MDAVDSNSSDDDSSQHLDSQENNTDQNNEAATNSLGHLSKRQLRKLKKHETWLEKKPEKRAKEKLKKKQRRQEARDRGETLGPTRKMLKLNSMEKSTCKVKVVLDCSFDEYMNDKDIMKLTKQVGFCYSANRRAENPLQFYVCGLHGQMQQRLESIGDYKNWDVNFTENDYHEEFEKDKIVYLSGDSPNVLKDLSNDHVYIIGGLVDHNQYKGMCHQLAVEQGMSHAQLPIGQYIEMKSRKVLTVNHVFEILLKYSETKDWKESFFSVIPQRKVVNNTDKEELVTQKETDEDNAPSNGNDSGSISITADRSSKEAGDTCSNKLDKYDAKLTKTGCDNSAMNDTGCRMISDIKQDFELLKVNSNKDTPTSSEDSHFKCNSVKSRHFENNSQGMEKDDLSALNCDIEENKQTNLDNTNS
ncbi:tRNA (guanine9-N1)-methyltransferase [Mytilus galloprovincialis]|uniref:tRNA (guanine(9)-N(1))-methyltransferase n=1 Tax=Mytilus galloprovincialis TaxID=29158 RepID=A0A8B6FJ68_MYTGA|nr:tRNA (guanine9-N1)-methyltransferase [Mytilus galloprovincialis]